MAAVNVQNDPASQASQDPADITSFPGNAIPGLTGASLAAAAHALGATASATTYISDGTNVVDLQMAISSGGLTSTGDINITSQISDESVTSVSCYTTSANPRHSVADDPFLPRRSV